MVVIGGKWPVRLDIGCIRMIANSGDWWWREVHASGVECKNGGTNQTLARCPKDRSDGGKQKGSVLLVLPPTCKCCSSCQPLDAVLA